MRNGKSSSAKIDRAVARSVDFELTVADIAKRSERRAWWVAASAVLVALVLAGGYYYMLPLKQKVPYLVMADAFTGTATVVRMSPAEVRSTTAHDAINRSNVAHFVLARESYDVTMMKMQDWVRVLTMSAPNVANAYRGLYSPNNENNPYKVYGRERAIRVNILSIVLLGNAPGHAPTGATVRFQRSVYDKTSGSTQPLDNRIATLAFAYKPDLRMDERYRIENPLGFQVTDYRVTTDYASTPPQPVAAAGLDSARSEDRTIDMPISEAVPADGAPDTFRAPAKAATPSLRESDAPTLPHSLRGPGQP